ncbi:MAG: RNA ligase family protein [Bacilli bacterium]|jgi:hypothetical protein
MTFPLPKPFPHKAYGSIPHLPGSKFGNRRDRGVHPGEARLYLERANPGDRIIVQEKLDGSCCAVAKVNGEILALIRNGRPAAGSQWRQHRMFARWVAAHQDQFAAYLEEGGRCVGEWLAQAHGTRYDLLIDEDGVYRRSPFVIFDYFTPNNRRLPCIEAWIRTLKHDLAFVPVLASMAQAVPLDAALSLLGENGRYGARDGAEGVVYRRETPDGIFLAKYVCPQKEPGRYLPGNDDPAAAVWNWLPAIWLDAERG